jgi:uroporphyrinogen decarboxylase
MTPSIVLDALRSKPTPRTPVWIMRQAGRYLPEYRAVRERHAFLTVCRTPELAAEVTLQPIRRFSLDAAILFSDILVPVEAMGAPVEFLEAGPRFARPVRTAADVDKLRVPDAGASMGFVAEAARQVRAALPAETALLGFAGAPFTLLTYLVEGGGSRDFAETKTLLTREPAVAHALLEKLAETAAAALRLQIGAGCGAVQLFDTWASVLTPADFEAFALPYAKRVFDAIADLGAPRVYYVNGIAGILESAALTGAECLSVDWRIDLGAARRRAPRLAFQGNLDPHALLGPEASVRAAARAVLRSNAGKPGHVFNLGHGIFPKAPVEAVEWMIDEVRAFRA